MQPAIEAVLKQIAEPIEVAANHTTRSKATMMTAMKLLTNALPSMFWNHRLLMTRAAIDGLLHPEKSVRSSAATLAFGMLQMQAKRRVDWIDATPDEADEAWEIEVGSAVIEALAQEDSEEVGA